ncbi:MAG: NADPH:quinone oxidoreductase family protein [Rhizobiaceae bacterium]
MDAVLSRSAGGPDALVVEKCPVPEPQHGQVLVKVHAIGVNYPDLLIIEDRYQFKPARPFSPGAEISGVVVALGAGVSGLRVGQRVMAMLGWGGMAGYVCVDAAKCAPIPDSMPFDHAAAFLMTYGTSYYALKDRGGLSAGETLLVLGAGGGVGLAAVELGRAMGARVVAAASSDEKLHAASAAGASATVRYPTGELARDQQKALSEAFKSACGNDGASVIYDAIGGDYAEPALRAIAWEGRYLVVGFPAGIPKLPLNLTLLKSCDVRGVFWGAAIDRNPARHVEAVGELLSLYQDGKIAPSIHQSFPLAQAADALRALASRGVVGKVIITVE